jgi:uncharacterized protein
METLIIFSRAPLLGRTKTRLAAERGDPAALRLAAAFLADTAAVARAWLSQRVAADQNRRVVFYVDQGKEDAVLADLAAGCGARLELQQGAHLGERLKHAVDAELARGARAVAVVGADSPTLPPHLLDEAFRALLWEPVVLGPTFDGGYWLIGVQRPAPPIFDDVPWSTPAVLPLTLSRLALTNTRFHLLPFWYDVDTGADLERLVWHVQAIRRTHKDALPATWAALHSVGLLLGARPPAGGAG